jgi:hypothetical protein
LSLQDRGRDRRFIGGDDEVELAFDHRPKAGRVEAGVDRPLRRDVAQTLDHMRSFPWLPTARRE